MPNKNKKGLLKKGLVRIQKGQYKGLKLWIPQHEGVRPTPALIRETLSNLVQTYHLQDHLALDLFAGSGAAGFELLSAGVKTCYFLEYLPLALSSLEKNRRQHPDLILSSRIIRWHQAQGLKTVQKHLPEGPRLIFADPPYGEDRHDQIDAEHWLTIFGYHPGHLFWQRDRRDAKLELPVPFRLVKTYEYSRHALDHFVYESHGAYQLPDLQARSEDSTVSSSKDHL